MNIMFLYAAEMRWVVSIPSPSIIGGNLNTRLLRQFVPAIWKDSSLVQVGDMNIKEWKRLGILLAETFRKCHKFRLYRRHSIVMNSYRFLQNEMVMNSWLFSVFQLCDEKDRITFT